VALRMFYRDSLQCDWKLWEQFEIRRDQPPLMVSHAMESINCWERCARTGSRQYLRLSITAVCVLVKPCGCAQRTSYLAA